MVVGVENINDRVRGTNRRRPVMTCLRSGPVDVPAAEITPDPPVCRRSFRGSDFIDDLLLYDRQEFRRTPADARMETSQV